MREDHKMIVNDFIRIKDETTQRMAAQILTYMKQGEKIVVPVTSKKTGQFIHDELKKAGVKNVRFYHGENDLIEDIKTTEEGQTIHTTHGQNKKIEFANVAHHWAKADCLIFTSTIVAGVDFPEQRFDRLIGALCPRTTSPSYFIQQLMRVRKFNKKEHFVYITNDQGKSSIITPLGAFAKATDTHSTVIEMCNTKLQLRHVLDSKNSVISTYQQDYAIDAIKQIGFKVEFEGVKTAEASTKFLESTFNELAVWEFIERFGYDSDFLEQLQKRTTDETDAKFIKPEMEGADLYLKTQIHFRLLGIGLKTKEHTVQFAKLNKDEQVYHIMHFENAKLVRHMFRGFPSKDQIIGNEFQRIYDQNIDHVDRMLEISRATGNGSEYWKNIREKLVENLLGAYFYKWAVD